jgi:DNA-binding response OmpR family regulator
MMVTAYGDEERRRLAAEYGAAEVITKPVDFDQLKAQLRQLPAAADRNGPAGEADQNQRQLQIFVRPAPPVLTDDTVERNTANRAT